MNSERMKKVYFNCEIANTTEQSIDAKYSISLLKPIIDDPMKYNITVNRFRLPLNGVPLSKKNVPFQQWQVGLGYNTASSGSPANWVYKTAYVPQLNPETIQKPINYYLVAQTAGGSTLTVNNVSTDDITQVNSSYPMYADAPYFSEWLKLVAYDLVGTGSIYSYIGSGQIDVYYAQSGNLATTIYVTALPNFDGVNAITVNPVNGDFFVCWHDGSEIYISRYERTAPTTWEFRYTVNIDSYTSQNNSFMALCNGWIYYINQTGQNKIIKYISYYLNTPVLQFETDRFVNNLVSVGSYLCFCDNSVALLFAFQPISSSNGNLILKQTIAYIPTGASALAIGLDYDGNLLYFSNSDGIVRAVSFTNGQVMYQTNQFGSNPVLLAPAISQPTLIDSGPTDIYHYQTYLNQINSAFSQVFTAIESQSGFSPADAPRAIYNPDSKLFSLVCDGTYINMTKYQILMNTDLWNMFLFPTVSATGLPTDNNGPFKLILAQNDIYNAVYGNGSTTPSFVTLNQESTTIFKFYDLVRILLVTSKIPVNGDCEGINSSVNLITDIVPDTSSLTPDDIIVYQPTVLRNYNLESNVPLRDLDIAFYYGCKDGSIYKVQLLAGEYASVKLEFEQVVS